MNEIYAGIEKNEISLNRLTQQSLNTCHVRDFLMI